MHDPRKGLPWKSRVSSGQEQVPGPLRHPVLPEASSTSFTFTFTFLHPVPVASWLPPPAPRGAWSPARRLLASRPGSACARLCRSGRDATARGAGRHSRALKAPT